MLRVNQLVLFDHHKWVVKSEGSPNFTSEHELKSDAIAKATQTAQILGSELHVYTHNGLLEYRNSYRIH